LGFRYKLLVMFLIEFLMLNDKYRSNPRYGCKKKEGDA
jgi:hypothetical protein